MENSFILLSPTLQYSGNTMKARHIDTKKKQLIRRVILPVAKNEKKKKVKSKKTTLQSQEKEMGQGSLSEKGHSSSRHICTLALL